MSQLFPLALTRWEELFVVDDYENYPANFMVRIRCSGRLPEELLRTALSNCIQSHPLFDCVVSCHQGNYYWESAGNLPLPVEFRQADSEPRLKTISSFDIAVERPWRVDCIQWLTGEGKSRTDIFVTIHHAICDGLGAIQFISDVAREIHDLTFFTAEKSEHSADPTGCSASKLGNPATDQEALLNRGVFSQSWRDWFGSLPYQYKSLLSSMKLIFSRVAPLVPVESNSRDTLRRLMERPRKRIGYEKLVFSLAETSRLRRNCRFKNTTVNSMLAATLFGSIAAWKKQQGHSGFKTLRLIMPFNERTIKDTHLPACNRVTLSPFTRSVRQISKPKRLLEGIERDVKLIKKARLGLNFHRGLWFCKTILGSLSALARIDRIGTTGMFSNVGNLQAHLRLPTSSKGTRCGPLDLIDIDLIPPIRLGTSFAMVVHDFNGQLRIGVHYDSNWIDEEQACNFLKHFKNQVASIAG